MRLESLRALQEAVKAGDKYPSRKIGVGGYPGPLTINGVDITIYTLGEKAYNGSLDAAHALHKAVLPGWGWCSATDAHNEQWFSVSESSGDYETEEIYANNPACAWLLAILAALIAQEPTP